jgi:hypothetical protein
MRAESLLGRADRWIFAPGDGARLAALRIGLCAVLVFRLATVDYDRVASHPRSFRPEFYMHLFDRMPSPEVVTALQVCGIVAALAAAAGLAFRTALTTALVCSLILNGILNSAGRIIVGDAVLTLCLLVLLAAGSATTERWSLRGGRAPDGAAERYGWPVRTAMIAIALAYFFAGLQKWRYSGLRWVTSDNLRWILYASSDGRAHPNTLALFIADRPLLAHVFAAGALLLETCFPLVLFVPALRWLFIPAAALMHVGIQLALGLDYSAQWLAAVVVFVNWPVALAWVRARPQGHVLRTAPR